MIRQHANECSNLAALTGPDWTKSPQNVSLIQENQEKVRAKLQFMISCSNKLQYLVSDQTGQTFESVCCSLLLSGLSPLAPLRVCVCVFVCVLSSYLV